MPVTTMTKLEYQLLLVHYIVAIFSFFLCLFFLYMEIAIAFIQKARQFYE